MPLPRSPWDLPAASSLVTRSSGVPGTCLLLLCGMWLEATQPGYHSFALHDIMQEVCPCHAACELPRIAVQNNE